MSTTQATNTSGTSASNPTQAAKPGGGQNARNASSGVDIFAGLLGLLSAAQDIPLDIDEDISDTAGKGLLGQELTDDAPNPLAALLSWPGAPILTADAKTGAGADAPVDSATGPSLSAAEEMADGIALTGMDILDQPEQADPELLANLQRNESPAGLRSNAAGINPARIDSAAFASRPANWRSTTALASPTSAAATVNNTTALQLGQGSQMRLQPELMAAAVRSTVALDERFSNVLAADDTLNSPLGAALPGHAGAQSGSGQPQAGGTGLGDLGASAPADVADSESDFTLHPELLAEEADPNEPALSPHSLRHANLRVGEGGEEGSIDIRLALQGEQLSVNFRTDNAETRAHLQQHANDSLADMLERNGIQLGDVSVGAQSQGQGQPGQQDTAPASRSSSTSGRLSNNATDAPAAPAAPVLRADGSRPLDVFA